MVTPVMQEPGSLRRDPPLLLIRQRPPAIDGIADTIDGLGQLVLLVFSRDLERLLVEDQRLLSALALLRLGDRCDEGDTTSVVEDAVGGLAALIELPVASWILVG